ncbi:hypothetical protein [Anaeromicropila populeti]|uniref:Lipoprotein n=1 Tax=Anaeromicropila populeti TaxID=37658 RepID=A0A1I6HQL8_9FIRM|nr:hypothetical protein [Anaeromicropila populeti]SFR56746.1 hypothetical protein SAMN05661086_00173 [Anaeromicropila populeti]
MKKKFYIFLYVGILILLVSCQKVPEEVMENTNSGDKIEQGSVDTNYDTLENIYKSYEQVKSNTYDNLNFSTDFSINMPEEIGLLTFKQTEHFYDNNKELLNQFVKNVNTDLIMETDANAYMTGMQYNDVKKNESFSICNNGFFFYEKYKYSDWINVENRDLVDYTLMDEIFMRKTNQNYTTETYDWNHKTFTLSDVIQTASNYVKEMASPYDTMDWIPENIKIYQYTSGEFFFRLAFTKSYKDVHLFYNNWGNKANTMKEPYVRVYQPILVMDSSLKVFFIDNYPGIIEYVETKETYDKIITLEYATEKLSELLSSYRRYSVQWISLEYRLILEGGIVSGDTINDTSVAGNVYEARPCWTFYLNNDPNNLIFAMVDCVTGEIEFVCNN